MGAFIRCNVLVTGLKKRYLNAELVIAQLFHMVTFRRLWSKMPVKGKEEFVCTSTMSCTCI